MDRTARTLRPDAHDRTPSPRTSSFVEAISDGFGRSGGATAMASTSSERQRLERLAQYSPRHRDVLRNLTQRDAEARTDRRLLEWCANFSPRCETRLRDLARHDARRDGWLPGEALAEALSSRSWDPSKHPRGGYPENPGRWSPAEGGGGDQAEPSTTRSRLLIRRASRRQGKQRHPVMTSMTRSCRQTRGESGWASEETVSSS